jgi:Tryptophan 2,3-dioxygenase (vermilion)
LGGTVRRAWAPDRHGRIRWRRVAGTQPGAPGVPRTVVCANPHL